MRNSKLYNGQYSPAVMRAFLNFPRRHPSKVTCAFRRQSSMNSFPDIRGGQTPVSFRLDRGVIGLRGRAVFSGRREALYLLFLNQIWSAQMLFYASTLSRRHHRPPIRKYYPLELFAHARKESGTLLTA